MTRATSRWSPTGARARCTPSPWPRSWAFRASSSRCIRGTSRPWGFWCRTSSTTTSARRVGLLAERAATLPQTFAEMEAAAGRRLDAEGFGPGARRIERALDLRYLGQAFELSVPLPPGGLDVGAIARDFHARHLAAYGHADPGGEVELVNARIAAYGIVDKPAPPPPPGPVLQVDEALSGRRQVWFGGHTHDCPVYEREGLPERAAVPGPAIVEEFGATTVIFPGWRAVLDAFGHLVLEPA